MNIVIPFSPSQMCPSPKVSNSNFHASAAESAGLASHHPKPCRVNIEAMSRKWGNQGGRWPSFSSPLSFFFSYFPSTPPNPASVLLCPQHTGIKSHGWRKAKPGEQGETIDGVDEKALM